MTESIVFESMFDEIYKVLVVRTAPYKARLSVSAADKELKSWEVGLAFNAAFGPDVADLQEWKDLVEAFIDGRAPK